MSSATPGLALGPDGLVHGVERGLLGQRGQGCAECRSLMPLRPQVTLQSRLSTLECPFLTTVHLSSDQHISSRLCPFLLWASPFL